MLRARARPGGVEPKDNSLGLPPVAASPAGSRTRLGPGRRAPLRGGDLSEARVARPRRARERCSRKRSTGRCTERADEEAAGRSGRGDRRGLLRRPVRVRSDSPPDVGSSLRLVAGGGTRGLGSPVPGASFDECPGRSRPTGGASSHDSRLPPSRSRSDQADPRRRAVLVPADLRHRRGLHRLRAGRRQPRAGRRAGGHAGVARRPGRLLAPHEGREELGALRHGRLSGEARPGEDRLHPLRPAARHSARPGEARHRQAEDALLLRADGALRHPAATGADSEPLLRHPEHRRAALRFARGHTHDLGGGRVQRLAGYRPVPRRERDRLLRPGDRPGLDHAGRPRLPPPRARLPPGRFGQRHDALSPGVRNRTWPTSTSTPATSRPTTRTSC